MWSLLWWHICCCLFRFIDVAFRCQDSWIFFFGICFAVSKLVTFRLIFPLLWCHHSWPGGLEAWTASTWRGVASACHPLSPPLSRPFHSFHLSHRGCCVLYSILFFFILKKEHFCLNKFKGRRAKVLVQGCRWKNAILIQWAFAHPSFLDQIVFSLLLLKCQIG